MIEWAITQTNRALQSEHDVSRAYVEMVPYALPYHNERWKNWDAAIALAHLYGNAPRQGCILDAGACRDPKYPSPFLPGAQKLGYQQLLGVNLDEKRREYENGICYDHGDITALPLADGELDYVACLSVIEHGVNPNVFLSEMGRIIKPGGFLFVSFDYWEDPIDTGDRTAFGAPVKIFSMKDVVAMADYAGYCGLYPTTPLDLTCKDRVVKWLGLEYTFCNLLFERR